jgi:drug/metabolite transporter (DMT)-like permease
LPLILLLCVGGLIAVTVDMSKLAAAGGVSGPEFAFWLSLGAGTLLFLAAYFGGKRMPVTPRHLRFFVISGFLSLAAPNVASFAVAQVAGANYGIAPFALSSLITYPMAIVLGLDRLEWKRFVGLFVGVIGTLIILVDITMVTASTGLLWALVALSMPVLVASGNIFRTLYLPKDTTDLPLAAGVMLGSAFWLVPVFLVQGGSTIVSGVGHVGLQIVLGQIAISALHYWLYMRLQRAAGPVYLSQIGYVAAAIGVVLAYLLFTELPSISLLSGIAMIIAGVFLVRPRKHDQT